MDSLLLVGALLLWTSVSAVGAALAAAWLPRRWGFTVAPLLLTVLAALPMLDEARAKIRFRALCQERAHVRTASSHVDGQPTATAAHGVAVHALGPLLAIETITTLRTPAGLAAYDYSTLSAQPGWFVRSLAAVVRQRPMLFAHACQPTYLADFLRRQEALPPED